MTATFFALFQVDICTMYFGKVSDKPLAYITLGVLLVFCFETSLNFVLKIDYGANSGLDKFTFYMLLDLIGTLSLIPDFLVIFGIELEAPSNMTLARVARTARIGARLTRLMKLFRSKGGSSVYSQLAMGDEVAATEASAASSFGEAVSDGISKRVVLLTLVLLVIVPFFLPHQTPAKDLALQYIRSLPREMVFSGFQDNHGALNYYQEFEEAQLVFFAVRDDPNFAASAGPRVGAKCDSYRPEQQGTHGILADRQAVRGESNHPHCTADDASYRCPVSCLGTADDISKGEFVLVDWVQDHQMRKSELREFNDCDCSDWTMKSTFYYRDLRVYEAWVTVMYMCFNIVVFGAATGAFLNEVFDLVVTPMERMCSALQVMSQQFAMLKPADDEDDGDELGQLGDGIVKLTDLLKVSLGDAGSKIITKNLAGETGELNAMVEGIKMDGYFGFCDIRDFPYLTEVLEEDIMVFTNVVSEIVHRHVSSHMGTPNKNIGDSWLSVWSRSQELTFTNLSHKNLQGVRDMSFADHSLAAFIGVMEEVTDNQQLQTMFARSKFQSKHPRGYKMSMGFGLHYGWAIEGAVGSQSKVDATYLSPHVNMSARLEAVSRQYGCDMVMSDIFYKHLSEPYQRLVYKLDRVVLVGTSKPIVLYTYDLGQDESNDYLEKKTRFGHEFNTAVDSYIHGKWTQAKKMLYGCLEARNHVRSHCSSVSCMLPCSLTDVWWRMYAGPSSKQAAGLHG
jgi:class 3 adenylate cyclase